MKKLLLFPFVCFVSLIFAQTPNKGIQWATDLSWEQVKEKAKKQNKYIFLDCYTTWCGPCKLMDRQVYTDDSVGNYFNSMFISVKVQMDKTGKDDERVKSWYEYASSIGKQYRVDAFPTFIFLSPEGKIVHRETGAQTDIQKFIAIAKMAIVPGKAYKDPYKKYDDLVEAYKKGVIDFDELSFMINMAGRLGDSTLRGELMKTHLNHVLTLSKEQRYTKANIKFWASLNLSSKKQIFQFFYNDWIIIDKVMNRKNYSQSIVDKTIREEIVVPFFLEQAKDSRIHMTGMMLGGPGASNIKGDGSEADWKSLRKQIKREFGKKYAQRNVLMAKIEWYERHRNFNSYTHAVLIKFKKWPPDPKDISTINGFAWNTFLYITDKKLIKEVIEWTLRSLPYFTNIPDLLDTHANLLYKSGNIIEAIESEKKAIEVAKGSQVELYKKVLELMTNREPTCLWDGAIWDGITIPKR